MGVYAEGASAEADDRKTRLLRALVSEHDPDLIALQEAPRRLASPLLRDAGYEVDAPRHRLLTAWRGRRWEATVEQPFVYDRASALVLRRLDPDGGGPRVLVCNVHLPSRLHSGTDEVSESLRDLVGEIQSYRSDPDTGRFSEVLTGDFNLEPHDLVMMLPSGLYGNRSLLFVAKRERRRRRDGLENERTRTLYNPSWMLYGASAEPLGTLYNTKGTGAPWYVFDQALFSADLADGPAAVEVVTEADGLDLLTRDVRSPNSKVGSDHLPLVWTLARSEGTPG